MRRILSFLLVVIGVLWVHPSAAMSLIGGWQNSATAAASASAIEVSVASSSTSPTIDQTRSATQTTSQAPPRCFPSLAPSSVQQLLGNVGPQGQTGAWYWLNCNGGPVANGLPPSFVPGGPPPAPAPAANPQALAQRALARATLPTAQIGTSPRSDRLLVNYPTFLFLRSAWTPVSASASAGGVSATVTARPTQTTWSTGDAATVTCDGPGAPYDPNRSWSSQVPPPCGHYYTQSSASAPSGTFTLTVTITYAVSWSATGAPGGGSLGTITRSSSLPVTVGEIQTLEH